MDDSPGLFSYKPLARTGLGAHLAGLRQDDGLQEDIAEIRARVFTREAAGETDPGTAEPQHRYQVDLNDETNVAALEDPGLQDHVRAAHRRLAEHEQALLRLPQLEGLRTKYLTEIGHLSALLTGLDEKLMAERGNVAGSHRLGRLLTDLLEGRSPEFVAPVSRKDLTPREALELIAEKSAESAGTREAFLTFAENDVRRILFKLRREIEIICDGLIELVEAGEKDRQLQREFVAASRAALGIQARP